MVKTRRPWYRTSTPPGSYESACRLRTGFALLACGGLCWGGLSATAAVLTADRTHPAPDTSSFREAVPRALTQSAEGAPSDQVQDKVPSGNQTVPTSAFAPMAFHEARDQVVSWLQLAGTDDARRVQIAEMWQERAADVPQADETLDLIVASFAAADPATQRFVDECHAGGPATLPPLEGARRDEFYSGCIQLYYARWLTQHRFYDEAIAILDTLDPDTSVDPASLFFYRAACQQKLLQPRPAQDSLTLLLEATLDVPARYRVVAEMMRDELSSLDDGGLPEVARVMSDVQRRLDLGRSGQQVQKQEDQVIALLDQLLEDMQQQQQQQSGGGSGGGGNSEQAQGTQGASQSSIKGSSAEGLADRKELTENGAWGMLDKQAEAQAKELIRQQFPSNYLDAISRYTQKIAERK